MRYVNNKLTIFTLVTYLILAIYLQIQFPDSYTQVINPLFWLLLSIYVLIRIKKKYFRFSKQSIFCQKMLYIICIYITTLYILGLIIGFTKLGNISILNMLNTIFKILIPIIGIEIARSYLVNSNKKNKIYIFITILIFIALEVNIDVFRHNLENREWFFKYLCSTLIPLIGSELLYTYLTTIGSYKLPLIYRITNFILYYIIPVIPDLNWFLLGSSQLIIITIIYISYKYYFNKEDYVVSRREKKGTLGTKVAYILSILLSTLLVFFMLGIFKYEPIAVLSNSMVPSYSRGDMLVYEKLNEEELKHLDEGNIIIYKYGSQIIAHRIYQVITEGNDVSYETKGDNNTTSDMNLVKPNQILGVYVFQINYVGYPSVFLHDFFNKEQSKVET